MSFRHCQKVNINLYIYESTNQLFDLFQFQIEIFFVKYNWKVVFVNDSNWSNKYEKPDQE